MKGYLKISLLSAAVVLALSAQQAMAAASTNNDVWGNPAEGLEGSNYLALGSRSSSAEGGTAIGYKTSALGGLSTAIGASASAGGLRAAVLGASGKADGSESVALGFSSDARAGNSVALGSNSIATESNTVSVGSDTLKRRLVNLADGRADTDAATMGQLNSLSASISANTVFGEGASNVITPAVTGEDGNVTTEAVLAQNAVIMGNNAKVQMDNSVAIGANSIASTEGRTATVHLIPADADGAWKSEGLVSFGGTYQPVDEQGQPVGEPVNFNRQLTGVAAGSEDNDAVNVAQLKQLENNTATQLNSLMTGETKVSTVQLTAVNEDGTPVEGGPTIGLRYQVASEAAQADGDSGAPTVSQGRLVYNNMDATGAVYGTETIATLSDGIKLSGGSTFAASGAAVDSVDVSLNQGISFLGDEYLKTTVTEGENGGAVVTIGASDELKKFLVQSGVQPSDPSNPSNPGGGSTGGTWTPNAAQQAALNGNFANGITVAAGEGNQAIQIKQGNVDMGGNRIQNVGNPINDGDAANKAYVDSTSRSLRNKINDVDKDLRAGVAMAMAVGNLPQAYMPGKSILAVSAGTYHGQGGFALGLSHATDNRQWVFKGAASVDTRGNFGGTLSAGYQF